VSKPTHRWLRRSPCDRLETDRRLRNRHPPLVEEVALRPSRNPVTVPGAADTSPGLVTALARLLDQRKHAGAPPRPAGGRVGAPPRPATTAGGQFVETFRENRATPSSFQAETPNARSGVRLSRVCLYAGAAWEMAGGSRSRST